MHHGAVKRHTGGSPLGNLDNLPYFFNCTDYQYSDNQLQPQ